MMLTGGTRNTRKTPVSFLFFPTTIATLSSPGVNPTLRYDKLATELWYGRNVLARPNSFCYS